MLFPQLRAEGGGFLPLKTGITRDITTYLAAHPETALTLDEWYCAVSCITSRRIYLQRTSVAGTPVIIWMVNQRGKYRNVMLKIPGADWRRKSNDG